MATTSLGKEFEDNIKNAKVVVKTVKMINIQTKSEDKKYAREGQFSVSNRKRLDFLSRSSQCVLPQAVPNVPTLLNISAGKN